VPGTKKNTPSHAPTSKVSMDQSSSGEPDTNIWMFEGKIQTPEKWTKIECKLRPREGSLTEEKFEDFASDHLKC